MRVVVTYDASRRTVEVWQKVEGVVEIGSFAGRGHKIDHATMIDVDVEFVDGVIKVRGNEDINVRGGEEGRRLARP